MKALLSLIVCSIITISCSNSGNETPLSPEETALSFLDALNINEDKSYRHFSLVKLSDYQENYIVLYDPVHAEYNAWNINGYEAGMTIDEYYADHSFEVAGPLVDTGENIFLDVGTGLKYSKVKMTSADTVKAQEIVDAIALDNANEVLSVQFGLPANRVRKISHLALNLSKANKATMTEYNYNQYSQAITGLTINEINSALNDVKSGNSSALDRVYKKAAKVNNITVEQVQKLSELFLNN